MEVTRTKSVTSQRGGGSGKMESVGPTSWSSGTKSAVQESSDQRPFGLRTFASLQKYQKISGYARSKTKLSCLRTLQSCAEIVKIRQS